ncbi:hypothetical protein CASFOL_026264 [Castilleja foliolosa]|uniref:Uncharacterized protein n=1 Tax=Castilleja foliolosa TaxID=1961234 RepID=A0ABD3CK21_9LAMI
MARMYRRHVLLQKRRRPSEASTSNTRRRTSIPDPITRQGSNMTNTDIASSSRTTTRNSDPNPISLQEMNMTDTNIAPELEQERLFQIQLRQTPEIEGEPLLRIRSLDKGATCQIQI